MSRGPERRCLGCGRRAPQHELVRYALVDGLLTVDPRRRLPGRGAYTCPDPGCLEQALRRRAFARSLRTQLRIPDGLGKSPPAG